MKKRIAVIASLALAFSRPRRLPKSSSRNQQEQGVTSGPAAGSPVEPSGAVQKDNQKAADVNESGLAGPSGTSAGSPGVEGKKGTQSGQEWPPPEEIRRKKGPSS